MRMDRIEAMKVFVAALDEGSLAAAGRRLSRSPAAVSRAIAFLENHVGAELLHRTTRSIRLSEAGERYAAACRRVLAELDEADLSVAGERASPRGTLTITAPPVSGEDILRPVIDAYLEAYPDVSIDFRLLDRHANLVDEGIDVALRVGDLQDSSMIATRVGGDVKRVVVASPTYLAARPAIREPGDLLQQRIITTTHFGHDTWVFPPAPGSSVPRSIRFKPRLVVNSVRAAMASAVANHGVTRLYTYHVADHVQDGSLRLVLRHAESAGLPVHLVTPNGRLAVPKVRSFVDFAVPLLRAEFARLMAQAEALGGD
ncbi:DNA-binding transcriptional LysR family regulator [Luteibacter sp. HA06]